MSKFAEIYADYCGVKLPENPPEFPTLYIPIPDKYITLQSGSGAGSSRNYSWYNEVMDMIGPILAKNGIKVVHIGGADDPPVHSCFDYRGKTNLRQAAFIVDNALLHLGNDSFFAHYAGIKNIPFVGIYGPTQPAVTGPFYVGRHIYLESHRNGRKPSHELNENPKSIDLVHPEDVAQAVLNLLDIDFKIPISTVHIGGNYSMPEVMDFIPDFPIPAKIFDNIKITCRLDLNYNLQAFSQAAMFYKVAVVTNKPIPPNIIEKFKNNIAIIVVKLDDAMDISWLNYIKTSGVMYQLVTKKRGKELNDIKIQLFDFDPVYQDKSLERELPESVTEDCFVRSKRSYLSNGQFFPSIYHWKKNIPFNKLIPFVVGGAIGDIEFIENLDYYHIYKKV